MDDPQPQPPRNSSRTLAMVAVAVLVVVAIAGIVLATVRGRNPSAAAPGAAESTQPAASAMTAAASASEVAAEDDAGPNQVVFAPGSDKLSAAATAKLVRIAEQAKKEGRNVHIGSKIESRADRAEQTELAKRRSYVIREVFEANGIALAKMHIDIMQLPTGLVTPREAHRVELTLR